MIKHILSCTRCVLAWLSVLIFILGCAQIHRKFEIPDKPSELTDMDHSIVTDTIPYWNLLEETSFESVLQLNMNFTSINDLYELTIYTPSQGIMDQLSVQNLWIPKSSWGSYWDIHVFAKELTSNNWHKLLFLGGNIKSIPSDSSILVVCDPLLEIGSNSISKFAAFAIESDEVMNLDPRVGEDRVVEFYPYDDAPVPIGNISPDYPESARRTGLLGTVVLEVEVYSDGVVGDIRVRRSIQSGRDGLDAAAIRAVRRVRFQPGRSSGRPIDTLVIIPIEFTLGPG